MKGTLVSLIMFFSLVPALIPNTASANEESISVYELPTKWKSTDDKDTTIAVAKGSFVILGMVYTSCPHACPMTITKIQDIEKAVHDAGVKDLKIVLASFDVKRDRPAKLKKFQKTRNLDTEKWHFLAPQSEADARELAVALGISYKDIGNGDFSHSNVISLLDRNGVIIAKIENLNDSPTALVEAIKKASAKE